MARNTARHVSRLALVASGIGVVVLSTLLSPSTSDRGMPGMEGHSVAPQDQTHERPAAEALEGGALQNGVRPGTEQVTFEVSTLPDFPDFKQRELNVRAGQIVALAFTNGTVEPWNYQHTWVLVMPGTADQVGILATKAGPQREYIPDSPDVLAHTRLLDSGESETIHFRAPEQPGDYPYICTFPGHHYWERGVLHVEG